MLVQPEMQKGVVFRPAGGVFQVIRDGMTVGVAQERDPRAAVHRLDEPGELSLIMVASL